MKSSLKGYHGRKRENSACGLGIIGLFSNRFRVSISSLEVVLLLAPIFHLLAIQVLEYTARFVYVFVARICV